MCSVTSHPSRSVTALSTDRKTLDRLLVEATSGALGFGDASSRRRSRRQGSRSHGSPDAEKRCVLCRRTNEFATDGDKGVKAQSSYLLDATNRNP